MSARASTLLAPADALRSVLLRWAAPVLSGLYADRRRRVWWLGVFSVVSAFVVAGLVPLWSLALGPVVLGVPHLVADVRYLVVRPGLHRDPVVFVLGGGALVATSLGAGPEVGVLAALPFIVTARGSRWRVAIALAAVGALFAGAWLEPFGFQLVFLHAHNLVAVLVWWVYLARPRSELWVPALTLVGAAVILAGGLDPLVTLTGGWTAPWTGTSFTEFVDTITPPSFGPVAATRLVLSFCFLQSVHYGVWLRLMPDDARPRAAPRTFAATWSALEHDFGRWPLVAFTAIAFGVAAWGAFSLPDARLGYLRLAAFHGYLELAVLARWFVAGVERR